MKNAPIVSVLLLLSSFVINSGCANKKPVEESVVADSKAKQVSTSGNAAANASGTSMDFVTAAKAAMPAVVHIKIHFSSSPQYGASGSGVIISSDGYIATNNHVVENASEIQVILPDKRSFDAKLVGRDPNTDLALIKIEAAKLPVVQLGNSDDLQIGEWVLAVGYPLSLNTTVTAGIVSAKARSIGIINRPAQNSFGESSQPAGSTAVESFIQTDAAINPGNSGGALVNGAGKLVGINSAIASQTGSYAGYAFAIPVNLAKKILDDLKAFGVVKRGVLGVSFPAPSAEDQYFAQQGLDPSKVNGVYITGVQSGSAAAAAGLREGDIIQSLDGTSLMSATEFSERIARHKPGDAIKIGYLRSGQAATATATLKGEATAKNGTAATDLQEIYRRLGASFVPLSAAEKQRFNLTAGVMVQQVLRGGFLDRVGILPGSIIAFINGKPISSPTDVNTALLSAQGGHIQMLAIAPDGSKVVFDFSLGA